MADAKGIKMVSAGAMPPDLAAQAVQAQIAQQLAEALLGSSMEGVPPVIHTAPGNPFARDVPNFAPIGKMFQSYMGSKRLGESSKVLADLAAQSEEVRQGDILASQNPINYMAEDKGNMPASSPALIGQSRKPNARDIAMSLIMSSHPENQAMGQMLMKAGIETEQKMIPGAGDMGRLAGSVDPASFPDMFSPGVFTGAQIPANPGAARSLPKTEVTSPGQEINVTQPSAAGSAGTLPGPGGSMKVGGNVQTSKERELPDKTLLSTSPSGHTTALPATTSHVASEFSKGSLKELKDSKDEIQGFQKLGPRLGQMFTLVENADLGITKKWVNDARRVAKDLGLSNDEANKITDTQSLMKLALPFAIASLRTISSRPSQLEYINVMEKMAADPTIDPRAALKVYRSIMTDALNNAVAHKENLESAAKLPGISKEQIDFLKSDLTPADFFGKDYPGNVGLTNNERGMFVDTRIGSKDTAMPSNVLPTAKAPDGSMRWKGKNGVWYTTKEEALAVKNASGQ